MPWIKCLGGGGGKTGRGKPLSVSQPIHLLVKFDALLEDLENKSKEKEMSGDKTTNEENKNVDQTKTSKESNPGRGRDYRGRNRGRGGYRGGGRGYSQEYHWHGQYWQAPPSYEKTQREKMTDLFGAIVDATNTQCVQQTASFVPYQRSFRGKYINKRNRAGDQVARNQRRLAKKTQTPNDPDAGKKSKELEKKPDDQTSSVPEESIINTDKETEQMNVDG